MGAFDAKRQDEIVIRDEENWEPGEFCTARTIVRSGDEEWVLNQQMLIQMPTGNRKQRRIGGFQKKQDKDVEFKSQVGAARRLWVQKMLLGWTFQANGMEMPFVESGKNELDDKRMGKIMQAMDSSYIDYIYEQIENAQPKQASDDEPEEQDEEDEEGEEGSPFFGNVSHSIDGAIGNHERTNLERMNGSTNTETRSHRNFLAKS